MPNPTPSNIQQPFSLKHARSSGIFNPRQIALMAPLLTRDYRSVKDEFDNLTIANSAYWAVSNTGTSSADPVLNTQAGGACRFVSGTSSPSSSVLYGARANHVVDDNPFLYVRYKNPAVITNLLFEIGFVNIATTKSTKVVTDIDTPSVSGNGLTDGVVLACDMSQTLVTPALVGVGTSYTIAKTNIVKNGTSTVWTPTASKWVDMYVGVRVGKGYCEIYEDDAFIGQFSVAAGPDTTTTLFPWLFFGGIGVAKTYDADVFHLVEERNTR